MRTKDPYTRNVQTNVMERRRAYFSEHGENTYDSEICFGKHDAYIWRWFLGTLLLLTE